jgi:predicted RNase H-like nuclease (RuvC/YqgF family)
MTVRDLRTMTISRMDNEVTKLEKELEKMRALHTSLQQKMFDLAKEGQDVEDKAKVVDEIEALKKEIGELVVTIRNLDARISRIKHRARRLKRIG